jgi:hypothetical protein
MRINSIYTLVFKDEGRGVFIYKYLYLIVRIIVLFYICGGSYSHFRTGITIEPLFKEYTPFTFLPNFLFVNL